MSPIRSAASMVSSGWLALRCKSICRTIPLRRKIASVPKKTRPLTRERIVAAAMALSAKDGVEALSMRRLGATLGVEAMSLYHLFPSKQHLIDALVDEAIGSLEFPPEDLPAVERMRRV